MAGTGRAMERWNRDHGSRAAAPTDHAKSRLLNDISRVSLDC